MNLQKKHQIRVDGWALMNITPLSIIAGYDFGQNNVTKRFVVSGHSSHE